MAMEATSRELAVGAQANAEVPEQSLAVACLLTISGGFLDAFTWLSLGGVFANSQTGNVVFLGMNVALGNWHEAAHHVPPILAFLAGAWVASRMKAPLLCLTGEIVALAIVMLLLVVHRLPSPLAIIGMSFGVALQTASFRQVERWRYLSVTVTGNFLRAVDQLTSMNDREAAHGARTMLTVCLMFLLGAIAGGFVTVRLGASSLIVPLGLLVLALWLCCRQRLRWPQT
jgi:uncharacterized membrane protein YoaK (UPF0700 family)